MRTILAMLFILLIAGCGNGPSPLVINRISPDENVVRGDTFRLVVTGVEDPSALTILVNDKIVAPEVVYFTGAYWVVVFTPTGELVVGENMVDVVEGDRQDSVNLEVHASRLPIETPPFVVSVLPEDQKVSPDEAVEITMNEDLTSKQVIVEMIELGGKYTNLTSLRTIEGDTIRFNMPTFVGEKVLLMVSVGETEIFDYIEFRRK